MRASFSMGLSAMLVSTSLFAQAPSAANQASGSQQLPPNPASGSDAGPFPPKADPSLNSPAELATAPTLGTRATGPAAGPTPNVAAPTPNVAAPAPVEKRAAVAIADGELDRAELEARHARAEQERMQRRAPMVEGGFTGQTSERDR